MDARQLLIDWDKRDRDLAVLEKHLRAVLPQDTDVALLSWIARNDRCREDCSHTVASKSEMAQAIGAQSRNTPVAVLRRLGQEGLGIMHTEVSAAGHELLVDWIAVWRLTPRPTCEQRLRARVAACRSGAVSDPDPGGGQGVVRAGQTSARVLVQESKHRASVSSVSVESAPRGLDRRLVRPWSVRDGLTSEDLVWAVRQRSRYVLQRLYDEAVAHPDRYWGDCDAHRLRYLACCWQAVESHDRSAMGMLQSLCRRHLTDDQRQRESGAYEEGRHTLTEASYAWAEEVRRQWNTPREYLEAVRAPRVEYARTMEV